MQQPPWLRIKGNGSDEDKNPPSAKRVEKEFHVAMGNITAWGKKTLKYLENGSNKASICLFCETHISAVGIPRALADALFRGWNAEFAAAAATAQGGTTGGAVVLAKRQVACAALDPATGPRGRDWVAMGLMLRGFRIIFIAAYFNDDNTDTSISLGNLSKLHEIYRFVKRTACPFVIGADWNMLGSVLRGISWLDDIFADIVSPASLDFTCTAGSGRTIDWFVVSRSILSTVTNVDRDPGSTWSPHIGLMISLKATPNMVRVVTYTEPAKIDGNAVPTC
jgi:hypothetical protein